MGGGTGGSVPPNIDSIARTGWDVPAGCCDCVATEFWLDPALAGVSAAAVLVPVVVGGAVAAPVLPEVEPDAVCDPVAATV